MLARQRTLHSASSRWAELRHRLIYYAVLSRNRVRRAQWDFLTPRSTPERMVGSCCHWEMTRPFEWFRSGTGDPSIDIRLNAASRELQRSWFCRYTGDLLLEPRYGYVIDGPMRLLDESMPFCEWSRDPAWRNLIGFPAPSRVLLARFRRVPIIREERVISLRFYWEENYFHFLNDVLPRLRMADEHAIPKDVPVVVGAKLADRSFFREAFPDGVIDGRRVIVQRGEFLSAREVVLARPPAADSLGVRYVADLLGASWQPEGTRRIFLNRKQSDGRAITNLEELLPVLDEFDFERVDADDMTLAEQVELFSAAEFIVGIHGAGLANMIFRRSGACAILEIFPPEEALPYYAHLATQLGFAYDALMGHTNERLFQRRQPFMVDATKFRDKVRATIERGPSTPQRPPAPQGH